MKEFVGGRNGLEWWSTWFIKSRLYGCLERGWVVEVIKMLLLLF